MSALQWPCRYAPRGRSKQQVALDTVDENCDCIFLHNTFQHDLAIAGALIAPRPLKFLNAGRDAMFPAGGYRDVLRQLTPFDEGTIVPEGAATLRVLDHYPGDTINDSIHRRFIPVSHPARAVRLVDAGRPGLGRPLL